MLGKTERGRCSCCKLKVSEQEETLCYHQGSRKLSAWSRETWPLMFSILCKNHCLLKYNNNHHSSIAGSLHMLKKQPSLQWLKTAYWEWLCLHAQFNWALFKMLVSKAIWLLSLSQYTGSKENSCSRKTCSPPQHSEESSAFSPCNFPVNIIHLNQTKENKLSVIQH